MKKIIYRLLRPYILKCIKEDIYLKGQSFVASPDYQQDSSEALEQMREYVRCKWIMPRH